MNDAVTATATAATATTMVADHRVAAKCARVRINLIWEISRWSFRKKRSEREKKKVETHSATISDVGPDRGFLDLLQSSSPKRERSAAVVRDTVNIFDLIAI